MTFSIAAADPDAGDWGVAVASRFPCVGAVVPWAKAGVGAVATQSWANTAFGPEGLELMGEGVPADETLRRILEADEGREDRQVGLVDSAGRAATFTGSKCMDWAGGATGRRFAAQGNILVGEEVVAETGASVLGERGRSVRPAPGGACSPATRPAGTDAGGSRRPCSWSGRAAATRGGTIGTSTFASTTIRTPRMSSRGSSRSGTRRCWSGTTRCCRPRRRWSRICSGVWPPSGGTAVSRRAPTTTPRGKALADWAGEFNLEGRLREDEQISNQLVAELRDVTPEIPAP